jgi:hypothetical protein
MNVLLLSATFAIYLYFLRPTTFEDSVNLLLPGFQGHVLQAQLIEEVRITASSFFLVAHRSQNDKSKTYLVTCPPSVDKNSCGIPGNALTAVSAVNSAQLANIDSYGR